MIKQSVRLILASLFLYACAPDLHEGSGFGDNGTFAPNGELPKNIVLLIGNGMGLSQITAGLYRENRLHLEKFPTIGIHKPYSFDQLIPDAAAGATAFSCGVKTYNGGIGVNSDSLRVTSILEEAELKGMSTGVISSANVTSPSIAAFYAHLPSGHDREEVAASLAAAGLDVFVGGGLDLFNARTDQRNLLELFKRKNYEVYQHFGSWKRELPEFDPERKIAFFTAREDASTAKEGRDYLPIAVPKVIDFLAARSLEDGFILVVEASHIDRGGRENDTEKIISEMIDFDKTIGAVMDFAKENGETLVLVTSDHETGGFALNVGSTDSDLIGAFTTTEETGTLLPVFAYGPGAKIFSGLYENTAIYQKMRQALDLDTRQINLNK